jgi:glutaredoxin-like protein
LGVDKIPAIAIIGAEDYGVRFYGIPSGYEFTSLLHAIRMVAAGKPELTEETMKALAEVTEPVHLQVFVTPTCPYCPGSVVLAHQMAVASPMVRADMVEATEFPHLAIKYQVMGVPRTVINDTAHIEGAAPEPMVLEKLREALEGTGEQA